MSEKNHGGARLNAGRPKNEVQKTVFKVRLTEAESEAIKIFSNTKSLSQAISKMINFVLS